MNFIKQTATALFATLFATLALAAAAQPADPATPFSLNYLGQQIPPSGASFGGTTIGGLSSLDYNKSTDQYFAISDGRSNVTVARFYELSLDLDKFQRSATPGHAGVDFNTAVTLQTPGGGAFGKNQVQFVALQISPVPEPGTKGMLLASLALICAIIRRGAPVQS